MTDRAPFKVVGMGPFPLPGEKKRHQRAMEEARRQLDLADAAKQRTRGTEAKPSGGEAR